MCGGNYNVGMEPSLHQKIKQARPPLYTIAPLTFSICWGYAIVNLLLGVGLFLLYKPAVPIAVANILSYQWWGITFFTIGAISVWSLTRNEWHTTRNLLLIGLIAKSIWAIALVIRCFVEPQTIIITIVWLFFAYIQAVTYIYFTPKINGESTGGRTS